MTLEVTIVNTSNWALEEIEVHSLNFQYSPQTLLPAEQVTLAVNRMENLRIEVESAGALGSAFPVKDETGKQYFPKVKVVWEAEDGSTLADPHRIPPEEL